MPLSSVHLYAAARAWLQRTRAQATPTTASIVVAEPFAAKAAPACLPLPLILSPSPFASDPVSDAVLRAVRQQRGVLRCSSGLACEHRQQIVQRGNRKHRQAVS